MGSWESIFKNRVNCPFFTDLYLWFAHWDNKQSFDDYPRFAFGNW